MRADTQASNAAPLDPRKAAPAIIEASDRKRIFELVLRATRTKARFAALLSVHTNEIRGQFALGDAAFDTRGVSELRIPRNTVPNLEKAIASGQPSIASLANDPILTVLTFEEIDDTDVWAELSIPGSPYAIAFDTSGLVLAKGTFNNLAQLESVLASAERRRADRDFVEAMGV